MHFLEHGVVILGDSPTQYQPIDMFVEDDSLVRNYCTPFTRIYALTKLIWE
jgi:hypothetical protein